MPVIPGTMLPQPPGGGVRYARSSMDGVRFLPRRTDGAQALAIGAGALEKAAGLWLQANIKAKEAKAAMDLDEIRVKAEAAYRDNMTALSQDPDGYETFGDRSRENFLTLRQDCRELLDGLPAEHRRKAELYLTGQAARWRDDTSRLQYQARVTALSGQAALSVQNQLNANDWNGARETVRVAVEQGVYTRAKGDALLADIGHREAFAGGVAMVKANPNSAKELTETNEDGSYKVNIPGLSPEDRERLAKYGKDLCASNAATLREQYTTAVKAGEDFNPARVEEAAASGAITREDADSILAVDKVARDRRAHDAFALKLSDGTLATAEQLADARAAVVGDGSLSDAEKKWRLDHLDAATARLEAKGEREASKEQSEFYSEQKMRILYPGLFGDGTETVTYEEVMGWAKAKKLTYGQAYDLLHTGMSIRERRAEAARQLTTRQAKVQCTLAIAEMEVPSDPAERQALFQKKDGDLFEAFFATSPETYAALSKELEERFSPDPKGWRANETLKVGWETYLAEQKEKDFYSVRTGLKPIQTFHQLEKYGRAGVPFQEKNGDRAGESFRRWEGEMLEWLARHPKATEKELREYGDALRMKINAAHVGGELDELFQAEYANLRKYDIRRGK